MKTFQPQHVFRISRTIFGAISFKLAHLDIFQTGKFIKYTLGSFIQVFIGINQATGKLQVIKSTIRLFSDLAHKQNAKLFSIEANQDTVH